MSTTILNMTNLQFKRKVFSCPTLCQQINDSDIFCCLLSPHSTSVQKWNIILLQKTLSAVNRGEIEHGEKHWAETMHDTNSHSCSYISVHCSPSGWWSSWARNPNLSVKNTQLLYVRSPVFPTVVVCFIFCIKKKKNSADGGHVAHYWFRNGSFFTTWLIIL